MGFQQDEINSMKETKEREREGDLGIMNETVARPCIGRQLSSTRKLQALYNCLQNFKHKTKKTFNR